MCDDVNCHCARHLATGDRTKQLARAATCVVQSRGTVQPETEIRDGFLDCMVLELITSHRYFLGIQGMC